MRISDWSSDVCSSDLCRDRGIDPREPKGSYAGAMGDAQFMPSNYRKLALDYDKDGQTDLWSLPDAIGSIANYFTHYAPAWRWRRGEPIAVPAVLTQGSLDRKSTSLNSSH